MISSSAEWVWSAMYVKETEPLTVLFPDYGVAEVKISGKPQPLAVSLSAVPLGTSAPSASGTEPFAVLEAPAPHGEHRIDEGMPALAPPSPLSCSRENTASVHGVSCTP